MSNVSQKFIDPAGDYEIYTSEVITPVHPIHLSKQTHGVIQVDWVSGSMTLEMKIHEDAPWLVVDTFVADEISEILLGNYMRIVSTGEGSAWLGEVR